MKWFERTFPMDSPTWMFSNVLEKAIQDVLWDFRTTRRTLVNRLEALTEHDLVKTAMHARLNKPMNIIDKMFFVAKHDDHHLACITAIWRALEA